ncbi:MAG: hypothetical protein ABIE70_06685 [bacterium]
MNRIALITAVVLVLVAGAVWADSSGRIYGKITTIDGDTFEGLIRWDKNEANWCDILDGTKEMSKHKKSKSRKRYKEREGTIELFGIELGSNTTISWSNSAQSGIRVGHIKTLEVTDDQSALLILKSGQEVELAHGSTDIGDDIREIIIEDDDEGEIELVWDDIERIDFADAGGNRTSNFGERLYGTLTTRRGEEFTGWVCWDVDEVFESDILDGEYDNRTRKIKFGKIKAIERYSSNGANVTLTNGDEMVLRETNDVNDGNRGIIIADPAFGQIVVKWDEFDRLEFSPAPKGLRYGDFDGGRPLKGTVYTEDGDSYKGTIRWDDDEEYTWEILDGNNRDIEFDIEFGLIKEIKKRSYRSSVVIVSDGREFRLRDSNDVDEDNKGIFITLDDGEEVEVEWAEFDRVEFDR